jgi:hypothetical protein
MGEERRPQAQEGPNAKVITASGGHMRGGSHDAAAGQGHSNSILHGNGGGHVVVQS